MENDVIAAYEFLRAQYTWRTQMYAREPLPKGITVKTILARFPKFSIANHQFPPEPFFGEMLNPLCIPRHFGGKGAEQIKKMNALKGLVRQGACAGDWRVLSAVGSPQNGGSFWPDWFLGRTAGDTPIAIFEHITLLNFIAVAHGKCNQTYRDWLRPLVAYSREYKPAQLNNHVTWKALFLLTSAAVLNSPTLGEEAYALYLLALEQINADGGMPLELARRSKAASYTRMNLEALMVIERLLDIKSAQRSRAQVDFQTCCVAHDLWKYHHGVKDTQVLPASLPLDWGWAFGVAHSAKFGSPCVDAYAYHFPEAWPSY